MKTWLALALAVLLSGCSGKEIPDSWLTVIEAEAALAPAPPAECATARDPKWKAPPEGDELAADTARREQANKRAFHDLAGRRRVCAAGLVVSQKGK
jgi:hypothetical protein